MRASGADSAQGTRHHEQVTRKRRQLALGAGLVGAALLGACSAKHHVEAAPPIGTTAPSLVPSPSASPPAPARTSAKPAPASAHPSASPTHHRSSHTSTTAPTHSSSSRAPSGST